MVWPLTARATDRPHTHYRTLAFSTFPQLVRKNGSICRFPHCEKRRDPFGHKGFQLMRTCRNRCFSTVSTGPSQGNSTLTRRFSTAFPQDIHRLSTGRGVFHRVIHRPPMQFLFFPHGFHNMWPSREGLGISYSLFDLCRAVFCQGDYEKCKNI